MTNFPPPQPGDHRPPPPVPGQPAPPTRPPTVLVEYMPDQPHTGRRRALIAGGVAVLALAAGAIFIATRDDGANDVLPRGTAATDEPVGTASEPPQTTVGTPLSLPTTAVPTTSAPPDDIAVGVPEGAVDLGHGVYFPIPEGWEITDIAASDVTTIGNGTTSLTLQAAVRPPGENPLVPLQEYVDTFDPAIDAVSYNPSEHYPRIEGPMAIDEYGVTYRFFDQDEEDGISITGLAAVYIRTDGLTVVYDVWYREGIYDIDGDSYAAFAASMRDAPALGDTVVMEQYPPFRVTSVHEFVPAFGLAGYTVTPGWTSSARADGNPVVSNADADFEMRRFDAVGSGDAAVQAAAGYQLSLYPNVTHDPPIVGEPDFYGHERRDVYWTGTLPDGVTPISGVFTVFYDSTTGNSVAMFEDWGGAIPNPYFAGFSFMFVTAADSYPVI